MHTIAEKGEGEVWVRVVKRGEGVEVRVVSMCVCRSVSIVVATFLPPTPSFKKLMGTAGPAAALSQHCF